MNTAYRIDRAGRLTFHDIPEAGLKIGPETNCVTINRGDEDSYFGCVLAAHGGMAHRIAPHTEFWFGPTVLHQNGDTSGGVFLWPSDIAVVSSRFVPTFVMRTLFHEAFHAVDRHLLPAARAVLDAAVARGAWFPTDYLRDDTERRARLFESFAMFLFEGGELVVTPATPEIEIMARIYFGGVGQEIVASMAA